MRSLYSIDKVHCSSSSNKNRSQSSSESNDDDRNDDIDDSFAKFLNESVFDQPTQPDNYDNVIDEALSDIFSPVPVELEGDPLLCEDGLLLTSGGTDLMETSADATIDLSQLCPDIMSCQELPDGLEVFAVGMKPEPRSPPSPDGSDSGVETYSVGFEYCDSPPVTPPNVSVTTAPPAAIIQVIKQEAPLTTATQGQILLDAAEQQVICFDAGQPPQPVTVARPLQPRVTPIQPAPSPGAGRMDVILPHTVSPGSSSTTYIITTPAAAAATAPRPTTAIQPWPSGVPSRPRPRPRPPPPAASDALPKARPLPRTVTVPPTRENMDPRALKRQERIIKNRMAACLSRKKKKDQFSEMEFRLRESEQTNSRLRLENAALHRRVAQLETEVEMLREGLQAPASPPDSPRKPLMLFSVLLLATLNLAPISSLFSGPPSLSPELGGGGGVGLQRAPGGRTLLWAPPEAEADLNHLAETVNASSGYMCPPKLVNQTEARRLSRVLHGWFDSAPSRADNGTAFQPPPAARPADTEEPRNAGQRRRKRPSRKRHSRREAELRLYDRWFGAYGAFLEAIQRRADTFYVVSFAGDHLMLPALSHNQTQRPRMSLLLPSLPLNESMRAPEHHVAMMQIDCEVVNTRLLHIHESAIPSPPVNHSAPAASTADGRLNDTGGKLNFSAPPIDGIAVGTALRWNGSSLFGRREKVKRKKPTRGKTAPNVTEEMYSAPSNSSVDSWRKLRFRNDSVDGAGAGTTFGPGADRQQHGGLGRSQSVEALSGDGAGAGADYFTSEH